MWHWKGVSRNPLPHSKGSTFATSCLCNWCRNADPRYTWQISMCFLMRCAHTAMDTPIMWHDWHSSLAHIGICSKMNGKPIMLCRWVLTSRSYASRKTNLRVTWLYIDNSQWLDHWLINLALDLTCTRQGLGKACAMRLVLPLFGFQRTRPKGNKPKPQSTLEMWRICGMIR